MPCWKNLLVSISPALYPYSQIAATKADQVRGMRNGFFVPRGPAFVAAIPAPSHNVTWQSRPELIWRCPDY
jgi:hypothetical protein